MPSLTTAEGVPVDPAGPEAREEINREFSRAMAAEEPGGVQAPPRLDDKPPAEAPKRRGRPPKAREAKPRVTEKPPAAPAAKVATDYAEACAGLTTLGWAALAATPYTSAYATVVEANADQFVAALNAGCQNNTTIRETVERWSSGGGGVWALQLAAVGTNMAIQTMQLMKDPVLRAESRAHTEGKFRAFLAAQGVKLPEPQHGEESSPSAEASDAPVAA